MISTFKVCIVNSLEVKVRDERLPQNNDKAYFLSYDRIKKRELSLKSKGRGRVPYFPMSSLYSG